ncbi:MAG TPA: NADH-quinone oxidoreductase subunit K, partial [Verrucomicrobiae bacterium]|nr:NADH-quinone oxidoreductase subunit K [Verrucomicrobiae bacterium]
NVNFVAFGRFCMPDKAVGQTFALFVIALAAAEVCIALSLILLLYRQKGSIDAERANDLKG